MIVSESQRLSRLIGNVLTFARKQNDKLTLHSTAGQRRSVHSVRARSLQGRAGVQGRADRLRSWSGRHGGVRSRCAGTDSRESVLQRREVRGRRRTDGGDEPAERRDRTSIVVSDRGPGIPKGQEEKNLRSVPPAQQQAVGRRYGHGHRPFDRERTGEKARRRSEGCRLGCRRTLRTGTATRLRAPHPSKEPQA